MGPSIVQQVKLQRSVVWSVRLLSTRANSEVFSRKKLVETVESRSFSGSRVIPQRATHAVDEP
eukprot:21510-Pelagococcus_subviridis.AAC.8